MADGHPDLQVPFKGNPVLFLAASMVFVLSSTGSGLIASRLVRTQQAALIMTVVMSTVPTILFSGLIFPVSSLSPTSRVLAHLFPGMYDANVRWGVFLKRVGLELLWRDGLALALYATVLRLIGIGSSRRDRDHDACHAVQITADAD